MFKIRWKSGKTRHVGTAFCLAKGTNQLLKKDTHE